MKAIRLGATGGLARARVGNFEDPGKPGEGQVRVRIRASSLNYHDYRVVKSDRPGSEGLIPMADGAGYVEEIGADVDEFRVGDLVVSTFFPGWLDGEPTSGDFSTVPGDGTDGYAAEVVIRDARWFTPAPRGWTAAEAATLTTAGVTAWRAIQEGVGAAEGASLLILGTGGVALHALQMAKSLGLNVIATSSSDRKLDRLSELGADARINYRDTPEWGRAVLALTDGRGVDQVLELGGPATLPQSVISTRIGGIISLIGTVTGLAGEVPTAMLMMRQQKLHGLVVGSRRQQLDLVAFLGEQSFRPVIDRRFSLEELPAAFAYLESGQHFGKVVVEF